MCSAHDVFHDVILAFLETVNEAVDVDGLAFQVTSVRNNFGDECLIRLFFRLQNLLDFFCDFDYIFDQVHRAAL